MIQADAPSCLVVTAACLAPAIRAARVNPIDALRAP
jgi:ABC-type lipoprotein release transport system permease subunit